jgi:hypothetical protein
VAGVLPATRDSVGTRSDRSGLAAASLRGTAWELTSACLKKAVSAVCRGTRGAAERISGFINVLWKYTGALKSLFFVFYNNKHHNMTATVDIEDTLISCELNLFKFGLNYSRFNLLAPSIYFVCSCYVRILTTGCFFLEVDIE